MKILFIGDPHFKVNNIELVEAFTEQVLNILLDKTNQYDSEEFLCVIAGDVLDTHERLHQTPYHKALNFIQQISFLVKVVILVGNHDFINNQQFLSSNHWMTPLKTWPNVYIADQVLDSLKFIKTNHKFMFIPYVPPGRFIEALETYKDRDWRDNTCIFAHQEFRGCNLGTYNSENGDKWPLHYPLIISGHIHKPHQPQSNIIYPGSVIQHSFGEEDNSTGIVLIHFDECLKIPPKFENIKIQIPTRISINISSSEFESTIKNINIKPLQRIRIICNGTEEEFKRIKKTAIYNNLPIGIQVTFKLITIDENHKIEEFENFDKIFNNLISYNKDLVSLLNNLNIGKTFEELIDSEGIINI